MRFADLSLILRTGFMPWAAQVYQVTFFPVLVITLAAIATFLHSPFFKS